MENDFKEVRFDLYCPKCVNNALDNIKTDNSDGTLYVDYCDACHDCMNSPYNTNSAKPIRFVEKQ